MDKLYLCSRWLLVHKVLRSYPILTAKVKPYLFQSVVVEQWPTRYIHWVVLVGAERHVPACVKQGATDLPLEQAQSQRGQEGVKDDFAGVYINRRLSLPNGAEVPGWVHQPPKGWPWHKCPVKTLLVRPPIFVRLCRTELTCYVGDGTCLED